MLSVIFRIPIEKKKKTMKQEKTKIVFCWLSLVLTFIILEQSIYNNVVDCSNFYIIIINKYIDNSKYL